MEKKKGSSMRSEQPKDHSTDKTMGASKLKFVEEEGGDGGSDGAATWLIGSIVEKGISDNPNSKPSPPSSFPKPTVLPFPVARHRSHGPHWAPVGSVMHDNDDDEEEDEDESFTGVDTMAAFAKPVRRKQNKGLDVSRWREITKSDTSSLAKKKEEDRVSAEPKKQKKHVESADTKYKHTELAIDNLNQSRPQENGKDSIANDCKGEPLFQSMNSQIGVEQTPCDEIAKAHMEIMEEVDRALPETLKTSKSVMVSSSKFNDSGAHQGSMTLQSEIDAENRARLQGMSPDEIEQAQAELIEKMNPALLEVLKRRGRDKFKKPKTSSSDFAPNSGQNNLQNGNQFADHAKVSTPAERDISPVATNASTKDMQRRLDNGSVQDPGQATRSLWDAWSQRVEAIRHSRFSLDGTIIKNDIVQASETGESFAHSDYSADNVAERDFLRTEGDPGAAGYTIKEAVALTRSVIPGQRALALHLLASVLDKALRNIHRNQVGLTTSTANNIDRDIDWEAIWAFALGPEPELVLSLRLCLDDNHSSVVLACAKVIQCILSCDVNENFFDMLEKTATYEKDLYTAPVFRSRPQVDTGFLHGGVWKYNAKPSSILQDAMNEKVDGEHTIQDDIFVAGQDIAAGLIRMGILPRMCYLLEADPANTLEDCIISIFIAIARHSPTCANAIIKCQRLVQTVINRFTMIDGTNIHSAKIKSVTLLKVLAQSDKKYCTAFIENGFFHSMMWHLYRPALSIGQWIKSGRDHCVVASALMVEQLRLWKVCIQYGYCVSYFADYFPALCLWLNPPTFEKLIENNVLHEFASVSMEAYLVLDALARRLPNIYSQKNTSNEVVHSTGTETETWSWSHVSPMIDLALKWTALKSNPDIIQFFDLKNPIKRDVILHDFSVSPLLWVIAAVMLMLSSVLERATPEDIISPNGGVGVVPWLPEFVPKIGLEIIKNGFVSLSDPSDGGNSFVEDLCNLRHQSEYEASLASICCLHGLVRVVVSVDALIQAAKTEPHTPSSQQYDFSREGKILEDGILEWSLVELRRLLTNLMNLVASEWHYVQSIETFGRGGPAPGVGLGWGASGGGFWSETVLLAQTDSRLLIHLLEIFQIVPAKDPPAIEEMTFDIQMIQSALEVCLIVGPQDRVIMEKALDILLRVPALKFLNFCVLHFIHSNGKFRKFQWEYKEEDYLLFSEILSSHFRKRWLSVKSKVDAVGDSSFGSSKLKRGGTKMDAIPEELDTSGMNSQDPCCTSLAVEWAHQRLPVPMHWFLSPISTVYDSKQTNLQKASDEPDLVSDPTDFLEVAKGGLFFLLSIEAMSSFFPADVHSPVKSVPVIWKLHSLSVALLDGMSVLEEEKSRDVFEALQELYGKVLAVSRYSSSTELVSEKDKNLVSEKKHALRFQSEIHESYSTFIETLVEQFSAISYGDFIYGRQVAVYLHRSVESPVRLAAWNALSNNRVLELLPPLDKCLGNADGYLEPVEDDEGILEAYVKSWVAGALDRAATRGSVAYTLVLHHLRSFIFQHHTGDKQLARNKLGKSLLRDYSRKRQHEGMLLDFIRYTKPSTSQNNEQNEVSPLQRSEIERRLLVLSEVCEGNSSLLTEVEKLKSFF